jgi:hypothetical protein
LPDKNVIGSYVGGVRVNLMEHGSGVGEKEVFEHGSYAHQAHLETLASAR